MPDVERRVVILGAAGRDFHDFNVHFRDALDRRVVAFTAAQIPYIDRRAYPPAMAGPRYPDGIPIRPEAELEAIIRELAVHEACFCYSDVSHEQVMHLASRVLAAGASFSLLGPRDTMLKSRRPVVAVVADRTGAGKSTITRHLWLELRERGWHPVVVRHPMPYGDLARAVQRFASTSDLLGGDTTVEEMEEYQQHVGQGATVFAGVDYAAILEAAECEGDVILWDGGNNDMPFYRPDVTVTVVDPVREGDATRYFPGEVNVRMADVLVIGKCNVAPAGAPERTQRLLAGLNAAAPVVYMASRETVDRPDLLQGRRVLVVEDGPSVTHGGLADALGARAARLNGATLVDPRPYATGSIAEAIRHSPRIGHVLPALGYSAAQLGDLERSIAAVPCDAVVLGTPAPLEQLIRIAQPLVRASCEAQPVSGPNLAGLVLDALGGLGP